MSAWSQALEKRASEMERRRVMHWLWKAGWVLLVTMILGSVTSRTAEAEETWVGKKVIQKYSDFELRVGTKVIDRKRLIEIYTVERENDSWIWLRAEHGELNGWARTEDVVPL